ncbi:hypothetical protein GCM10027443_15690 [Pontibacter brevis]
MPEGRLVLVAGGGVAAVKSDICSGPGCNNLGLSVSGGALFRLSEYLSVGGLVEYARLGATGADSLLVQQVSFQSDVIELAGTVVVNLLESHAGTAGYRSARKRLLIPYVRAGAGLAYYSPTSFPGEGDLNTSQTTYDPERKYPAFTLAIPFGAGVHIRLTDAISISPELVYRITTTDHLDNIGARAGSPENDHYAVAAVKVLYTPLLRNKLLSR